MPVKLEWDPTLPVLWAVFSGMLSGDEYYGLCQERMALLDAGPEGAIVVADTRQMERFPDSLVVQRCSSAINHAHVSHLLIVLREDLYRTLRRGIEATAPYGFAVQFFTDPGAALQHARALVGQA